MKKKLCISFSGGRTSAFMTFWCLKHLSKDYDIVVVFANTGKEREETLQFVDMCDKYWGFNVVWVEAQFHDLGTGVTAKVVDFETASRKGEPFEAMIAKLGIPNQANPQCSRELKGYAIRAYMRDQLGWAKKDYQTAIGIRADEPGRINWETAKRHYFIYPLVTMIRTTKSNINQFWANMPFDLQLKSYEGNCDLCWKKSKRILMTLINEQPDSPEWWLKMERKYGFYIPEQKRHNEKIAPPIVFGRGRLSMDDLIEEAKFPFAPAQDQSKIIDAQLSMWDEHMDANFGCTESCEVVFDDDEEDFI